MKSLTQYFNKAFFDESYDFEYRIGMLFIMQCVVMSVLSLTINLLINANIIPLLVQVFSVFAGVWVLTVNFELRSRFYKPYLMFSIMAYLPFTFFQIAGYWGTVLLFAPISVTALCFLTVGRLRTWLITLNISIYVASCTIQYIFPDLIEPYSSSLDMIIDLIFSIVLAFAGIAALSIFIKSAYEQEQKKIGALIEQLEQSNKYLTEITNRDSLTNAYNRRFLEDILRMAICKAQRLHESSCVLMLDLDHFKRINDNYGHAVGDKALIAFTQAIQNNIRSCDVLARFGGEEFVVVLDEITLENAIKKARKFLKAVEAIDIGIDARITTSIGLTKILGTDSIDIIINRADKFLYAAKSNGRNRVEYSEVVEVEN